MLNFSKHIQTKHKLIPWILILVFFQNSIYAKNELIKSGDKIHTIVIDPGHGGKDPGAIGKTSYEKDIVLAIGLKLGKYIEENIPDVKVLYTRTTDEFVPLYQRAEIANKNQADLFISLHVNGGIDPKTSGTETLVLGLHRADENFEVAKRENSVILLEEDYTTRYENFDPNSLESYIIFSLMQNVYDNQSISFAGMVQDQFRERVRRKDRGVKRQGLLVLAQTSMPGVLIEAGFITNPAEEAYLVSEEGQDYIASAIYRAFKEYKTDIESKSGNVTRAGNNAISEIHPASQARTTIQEQKPSATTTSTTTESTVYFKVQVAVSSAAIPLNSNHFSELTEVEEFRAEPFYKYAVGYKKSYSEILEYCKWVKNRFPDAFVISVKNGAIIPLQEAIEELRLK